MLHFQKLDVYRLSIEFLSLARRMIAQLPKGYGELADQLRRSSQSTQQNIAEGCGRTTRPDKARHYTIARGSAMESASHLDCMQVEEIVPAEMYTQGIDLLERIVAMLTRMIGPLSATVSNTPTVSFPSTSAATIRPSITSMTVAHVSVSAIIAAVLGAAM